MTILAAAALLLAASSDLTMPVDEPVVAYEIDVAAPVARVWAAWATPEGARTFFAPQCHIDPRVMGAYEIHFNPAAPAGQRGSDGCVVLALQEPTLLSFTWNAPPQFPNVRAQRTSVVVRLREIDPTHTRVTLTQSGWGDGEEWDAARAYFEKAWGQAVLPLLKHSLEVGPVDWSNRPASLAAAKRVGGSSALRP